MSRFFSKKYDALVPYIPGEQPKEQQYIKLNTNESPFPPSPTAQTMARKAAENLQLYSDPECRDLIREAAEYFGVDKEEILFTNGSDEILNFAFMAFCDKEHSAVFPNITYGFYSVFAELNGISYREIPLRKDFRICVEDYLGGDETVFLANPNAPTGIALPRSEIERIVASNRDRVVVIDEAYVDFGGESALPLVREYDNLLVVGTMSKSRSLAGARLGFGFGCRELIKDLNIIKYSTNPYNINRMTEAAGIGALRDADYFRNNCIEIVKIREWTTEILESLDFFVLPSCANFVFAKHKSVPGYEIYRRLREKGVLIRHFDTPLLKDYNRISIGSREQMKILAKKLKEILETEI